MILNDILNDVYMECPGCSRTVMQQQLRLVARDFCVRTEAWTDFVTKDIVADTEAYNLNTGYSANIQRILWVKYGESATEDNTSPLDPYLYKLEDEWTLTLLFDCPSAITDGLYVKMALRPQFGGVSDSPNDLPEWFIDRYSDVLSAGTKAKLMRMLKMPWGNAEMSQFYNRLYDNGVNMANIESKYSDFKDGAIIVEQRKI